MEARPDTTKLTNSTSVSFVTDYFSRSIFVQEMRFLVHLLVSFTSASFFSSISNIFGGNNIGGHNCDICTKDCSNCAGKHFD